MECCGMRYITLFLVLLMFVISNTSLANNLGVNKMDDNKYKKLQEQAEKGDAKAQYELANIYAKGEGVEKDLKKAVYWYEKAAEQGHSYAQYNLGLMYYKGLGVEKDFNTTRYWYEKAAAQGDEDAQRNLDKLNKM
jgi:uncharacterized protein